PVFQQLERVQGDMGSILGRIRALAVTDSRCWLEVIYDGDEIVGDLRDLLADAVAGSELKILRVRNNRIVNRVLEHNYEGEALEDLSENDVFERCLNAHNIPEDQRPELLRTYQEALVSLREDDQRAE
nr:exonuclease SbcCD subunit D C-terminal domain-containing protein [Pseudomonadota bacterium]